MLDVDVQGRPRLGRRQQPVRRIPNSKTAWSAIRAQPRSDHHNPEWSPRLSAPSSTITPALTLCPTTPRKKLHIAVAAPRTAVTRSLAASSSPTGRSEEGLFRDRSHPAKPPPPRLFHPQTKSLRSPPQWSSHTSYFGTTGATRRPMGTTDRYGLTGPFCAGAVQYNHRRSRRAAAGIMTHVISRAMMALVRMFTT